jgi:3-oxoacyl-[acyl-carrier-protein] synthase III
MLLMIAFAENGIKIAALRDSDDSTIAIFFCDGAGAVLAGYFPFCAHAQCAGLDIAHPDVR